MLVISFSSPDSAFSEGRSQGGSRLARDTARLRGKRYRDVLLDFPLGLEYVAVILV